MLRDHVHSLCLPSTLRSGTGSAPEPRRAVPDVLGLRKPPVPHHKGALHAALTGRAGDSGEHKQGRVPRELVVRRDNEDVVLALLEPEQKPQLRLLREKRAVIPVVAGSALLVRSILALVPREPQEGAPRLGGELCREEAGAQVLLGARAEDLRHARSGLLPPALCCEVEQLDGLFFTL